MVGSRAHNYGVDLVWCLDSPSFGGSEKDLIRVMEMLHLQNEVVLHGPRICQQLGKYFERRGIPTFSDVSRNSWQNAVGGLMDAWRWLKRFPRATFIVWAHHCDSHRWLQLALAWQRRQFIVCERLIPSTTREARNSRSRKFIKHFVARRAFRIVTCGHDQALSYRKFFCNDHTKVAVILNSRPVAFLSSKVKELRNDPVRLRESLGLTSNPLVVCVGRLATQKDQATLIRAMGLLASRASDMPHLILVGEGENESLLRNLAKEQAPGTVIFAGHQSDPLPWLAAADVFVLPSLCEGLPGALIEAMAAGLPCVASDIPGNRDLIQDGRTGLLVPVKDPAALASAIKRMLSEADLASRCAQSGYELVAREFDESTERESWLSLIGELTGNRGE